MRQINQKKLIYGLSFISLLVLLVSLLRYQSFNLNAIIYAVSGMAYGLWWITFLSEKSKLAVWTHPVFFFLLIGILVRAVELSVTKIYHPLTLMKGELIVTFAIASWTSLFGFGLIAATKRK